MIQLPKSIFFLIILRWNQHALATDQECEYNDRGDYTCPNDEHNRPFFTCRVGSKSYDELFIGVNTVELSKGAAYNNKYCECNENDVARGKSGRTGGECEIKFSRCLDGQVCFNGAPCIKIGDEEEFICGCAYTSDRKITYVGEHCEYEVDDFCDDSSDSLDSLYDISKSGAWFCTNNGMCLNGESDPEEKCKCDKGFYGLHCEFKDENSCDAVCENEGYCSRGVKDFSILNDDMENHFKEYADDFDDVRSDDKDYDSIDTGDDDFYSDDGYLIENIASYCVCPEGWTGKKCEFKIDDCGENVCMNGASCRAADMDNTNSASFYCDCSDVDILDDKGNIVPHAGMSCQKVYTEMCDAPDGYSDEQYFCTNGGTCGKKPYMPCECRKGFSGPRCEFEGDAPVECSLPCQNDGQCYFGDSSPSDYDDMMGLTTITKSNPGFHCKCPQGYFGRICELKAEVCGDLEHYCQNSGKCVKKSNDWDCDCAGTVHAGVNCQHVATSFCIDSEQDSFCTNHGKCKESISEGTTTHPGCVCDPLFHGESCEYEYASVRNENNTASKAFLGFTLSLFGLLAIFLAVHFFNKKSVSNPASRHYPIGIPPEVHLRAVDLDTEHDNTMCMGSGFTDEDYAEAEVMQNVPIK